MVKSGMVHARGTKASVDLSISVKPLTKILLQDFSSLLLLVFSQNDLRRTIVTSSYLTEKSMISHKYGQIQFLYKTNNGDSASQERRSFEYHGSLTYFSAYWK